MGRRGWLAIGLLVAIGCDASEEGQPRAEPPDLASLPEVRVYTGDGARAERRIAEGCNAADQTLRSEAFVDDRALVTLSWTGLSEYASRLKIPVYVVATGDETIAVRFLQFPMREEYLHLWLGSGHIRPGPDEQFFLDPCSAALEPWPYPAD